MSLEGKRTPLYDRHLEMGARIINFSGWLLPVSYSSIVGEHLWTRENASLFDVSHMGRLEVEGAGSARFLDGLLTNRIASLEVGQCRYTLMLNEDGGILDDLIVYRLDGDRFMLVVNAGTTQRDYEWIDSHLPEGLRLSNRTSELAKIDLQGPRSREVLEAVLGISVEGLRYFRFVQASWRGLPLLVSRTGYTGELGYELYIDADKVLDLWNALLGHPLVRPAGLGARDTLRLEVGYPLYGQDIHTGVSPVSANLERFVDWDKDFIGKERLLKEKEQGVKRRLIGVRSETRRPFRHGDKVFSDAGKEIGEITSGSYSPSLGLAIGLAYVDAEFKEGDAVRVKGRGQWQARLFSYPFYTEGTVRLSV